jgi:hypothetical protein
LLAGLAHLPAAPLGDGALRIRQHVDKEPVMKKQSAPISHVASRRGVNLPIHLKGSYVASPLCFRRNYTVPNVGL